MKKMMYLVLGTILLFSCKKEGCIDPIALNYNPDTDINNGSCVYYYGCTDQTATNYNSTAVIGCDSSGSSNCCTYSTPYHVITPYGFPDMIIPENNPMTIEGIELGRKLFNDPILSGDGTQSCISCHVQSANFSDTNQFSTGINGSHGDRNASTIINAGWNNSNFWDGRALTLEDQSFDPVVNPIEMNDTWLNVENKLNYDSEYVHLFKQAFNIDYIDSTHVVMAIAQFERSLVSANSKFDKFYRGEVTMTASELNGYAIFNSEKGDCFHCHGTLLFTDNLFHNNGLDSEPFSDLGLANVTNDVFDNGKFKTPSLRNIEVSAPYMHDGRFTTLEQVVNHYDNGGEYSTTIDPLMKKVGIGLNLTNQEKADLIDFLKTLTDYDYIDSE